VKKTSDFDKICYTAVVDIEPNDSHGTKNWNFLKFKMAAAARHLENHFFGHKSSICSISAKFCMRN